jgi:hypothetical protein
MTLADLFPTKLGRDRPSGNDKAKAERRAHPTPEAALAKPIREFGQPTSYWVYHLADAMRAARNAVPAPQNPADGPQEVSC